MAEEEQPDWLEQIDHTGDAGFTIFAENEVELFERAAWAMFNILTELEKVDSVETEEVAVEATDREALMVKWLSELNYRHLTEYRLYREFDIEDLTSTSLKANVTGERFDSGRHTVYTEIKAVTYHGLEIGKTDEGFQVQVIFDL